jgi:cytochrome c
MKSLIRRLLIAAASATLSVPALADGDPDRGKKVFNKCSACHVVDQEKNRVGPHLVGLFGRTSGSVEGFKYSTAMKEAQIIWEDTTLDAYLENPKQYVKGTRMSFAGLKKEKDRQDVIAYLKIETAKE